MACVFLPVLTGVAVTNYVVDPGDVYRKRYVDKIIEGHGKDLHVTNVPDNIDDRTYKLKLCELNKNKSFDILVIGNSRLLTISSDMFPHSSVLNLALASGKLEDYVAFYQICKQNNIHYDKVFFCADPPTLFNENFQETRWKNIEEYYYGFLNQEKGFDIDFSRFENLFSLSYFQTAVKEKKSKDMAFVNTPVNKGKTYRKDGSLNYKRAVREMSLEAIDGMARTEMLSMFNDFESLSEERKQLFDTLIQTFKKDGVEVLFFRSPYHPIFYKRIENIQGMKEGMEYMENYAKDNHIQMIGHFNPVEDSLSNKDFYDHVHPRSETMERLIMKYLSNEKK